MYYRIRIQFDRVLEISEELAILSRDVSLKIQHENDDHALFGLTTIMKTEAVMLGMTDVRYEYSNGEVDSLVERYLEECHLPVKSIKIERLTYDYFSAQIDMSGHRKRDCSEELLNPFETFKQYLTSYEFRFLDAREFILEHPQRFEENALSEVYKSEVKRIRSVKTDRFTGHPIHYKVISEVRSDALKMAKSLSYELYHANRLLYPYMVSFWMERIPHDLMAIPLSGIQMAQGGACFIDLSDADFKEFDNAMLENFVRNLSQLVKEYRHQILFFIYSSSVNGRVVSLFENNCSDLSFLTLREDILTYASALRLLKSTLVDVNLDKSLAKSILPKKKAYLVRDVIEIFNIWYDDYLKKSVYPQYQQVPKLQLTPLITEEGSAYEDLQAMIGLKEIKALIDQYINHQNAQQLYKAHGITLPNMTRHMVFTGPPGTAKTSIARLIGRILKENRLLPIGDFHEVGRADLIEKYVGWTARNVRQKVREAMGSILFIDEAYSLLDGKDHGNSYGTEAVATLVQEMENHRDDLIIIFAGYTKEMSEFLNSNPGLRSRIGFTFDFKNYNLDELMGIARKISNDLGFVLDGAAIIGLRKHLRVIQSRPDFGNGRDVRTLIEQAILKHGAKLAEQSDVLINKELLTTITIEDFEFGTSITPEYSWHRLPKELN